MSNPRVLFVYKSGGPVILGDRIRIETILKFLRNSGFKIIEARLPSITRWTLWRAVLSLFPLHKKMPIFSYREFLPWLDVSVSINSLKAIIRKTDADVVLAETSLVGWVATLVCESCSIPCIVDCHGLAFAEAKGAGHRNWRYIKHLERETFLKCDHLLVVSEQMKDYVSKAFKIRSDKILVVPNGSTPQQFIAKYRVPLRVIYAGVFSYWEKVHDFLDVAKQTRDHRFNFYMAGEGPVKEQLLERIRREKIPLTYLGYIPRQKIFSTLSTMQIGMAPSTRDLARIVASPIKVFDYMASGLPVITPKIGDWGKIIEEEDCGIALEDDNPKSYEEALNMLAQQDVWTTKSKNAINIIKEKYNWDNLLRPLANLISNYR